MNFFIVGTSRSGSTLLRQMLSQHPSVAVLNESHWLPHMWDLFRDRIVPLSSITAIVEEIHWDNGRRVVDVNLELASRSWEDLLSRLRDSLGESTTVRAFHDALVDVLFDMEPGSSIRGDKTPDYGFYMPMLQEIWPEATFVHITRNWIDTARSMSRHPGCQLMISLGYDNWVPLCHVRAFEKYRREPLPFDAFVRSWYRRMERIRHDGRSLRGATYLEVRYEDLLADTASVLHQVAQHIGAVSDVEWLVRCASLVRPARPRETLTKPELDALTTEDLRELRDAESARVAPGAPR